MTEAGTSRAICRRRGGCRAFGIALALLIAVLCALGAAAGDAAATGPWSAQTSGTATALQAVTATSATTAWAVGYNGVILNTTDGGVTWTAQTSGSAEALVAVSFADADNGWAVGSGGTILHTTDGGATWSQQTSGTSEMLFGVACTSATTAWAVGFNGVILNTTDGGTTWTRQTSGTDYYLHGVTFADSTTGWVVGAYGTILYTSDGGTTWTSQTSATPGSLYDVSCASTTSCWAVNPGSTSVFGTADGGTTWTSEATGSTGTLHGVSFVSSTTGWVVGASGAILATTDGGTTWTSQTSGTANTLNAVSFPSVSAGWAVGDGGTILKYTGVAAPTVGIAGYDNAWHAGPVDLTVTATVDPSLTLSALEYWTGTAWTEIPGTGASRTLTITGDGYNDVFVRATDSATQATVEEAWVKIDTAVPAVTVSGNDSLWHTSPVTLTFTPSPSRSGFDSVEYRVGSGPWTAASRPEDVSSNQAASRSWTPIYTATISTQGANTVSFRVTNGAGTRSAVGTCTVKIDSTAPRLRLASDTLRVDVHAGAQLPVKLRWTDAASTRATLRVVVTRGGQRRGSVRTITVRRAGVWQTVSVPWSLGPGTYNLHLTLTDQGGHSCRTSATVVARR